MISERTRHFLRISWGEDRHQLRESDLKAMLIIRTVVIGNLKGTLKHCEPLLSLQTWDSRGEAALLHPLFLRILDTSIKCATHFWD